MVLLIDANVILDVLLKREEFIYDSSLVWKLCETKTVIGYVSTLTFANLVYIMRKQLDHEQILKVFEIMEIIFKFADLTSLDLKCASSMNWNNFEDALQSCIAKDIKADYIITRNVSDFNKSKVKAITPHDFLSLFQNN